MRLKGQGICIMLAVAASVLPVASCSTTRVLAPDESRLEKNIVRITDSKTYSSSQLIPYIKQQPNGSLLFGWNPLLNIYNWSDGSDKFFSKLWRKLGVAPVVYNSSLVGASIENITNHLHYQGYYHASVTASESTKKRRARVTYTVTLGDRMPLSELTYTLPSQGTLSEDFFADKGCLLQAGVPLSEETLEAEASRSASFLRNKGYYGISSGNYFFHADTLASDGTAKLDYGIREYTRGSLPSSANELVKYRFGEVRILTPDDLKVRPKLLSALNAISEGDQYSDDAVHTTYGRFTSMNLFGGVSIETKPRENGIVDCDISLSKAKQKGLKVNLEASATSTGLFGVSPKLTFYDKNIFHGGEMFSLGFSGDFQMKPREHTKSNEFGVSARLSFPAIAFLHSHTRTTSIPRTEVGIGYTFQDRPEFKRHLATASVGFTGSVQKKFFYQVSPLKISYILLNNLSDSFRETVRKNPFLSTSYYSHIDAGLVSSFYLTTCTDIVPKVSWRYIRLNLDASGNVIGAFRRFIPVSEDGQRLIFNVPFSQYVRGEVNMGATWRFGRKDGQAFATRFILGAGYAYGNSVSMPFEEQFFVGGASSMRGWQARTLGPGGGALVTDFLIPSQTGDFKLELDLEYRLRLFWKFEAALFAESGNVWMLKSVEGFPEYSFRFKDFYKTLAGDWGFGLRLNLDFILIRLDLGLKVYDPTRAEGNRWVAPNQWFKKNGYTLNFGIGYPF